MLLAIGGHPRSGTTLLCRLCAFHPEILMTQEFRCFQRLGVSWAEHLCGVRMRGFWDNPLIQQRRGNKLLGFIQSRRFLNQYRFRIARSRSGAITEETVGAVLRSIAPWARVVGDKFPEYIFQLDRLAAVPSLRRVIIYRDCRDVARSAIEMSRTKWRGKRFAASMDSASKVAKRWVWAVELIERYRDQVHLIRYEDLVADPGPVLASLGAYLDVDPQGFPSHLIHTRSVGRHREELSAAEIQEILAIAGPTMARLGYQM